jgi:mono/diheme cytochrome c family protein
MLLGVIGVSLLAAGCHTDLWVQPHLRAQTYSDFGGFSDHATSRPDVPGAVARGQADDDTGYYKGRVGKTLLTDIPVAQASKDLNADGVRIANYRAFIERGHERFTIYCTPCHGQLGDGNGMIAQRGFAIRRQPATYHTDRLRKMPVGHFFDVITNGYGTMFSYAARVEVPDRWAIAAYIRALQLSQNVKEAALTSQEKQNIKPDPRPMEPAGVGQGR